MSALSLGSSQETLISDIINLLKAKHSEQIEQMETNTMKKFCKLCHQPKKQQKSIFLHEIINNKKIIKIICNNFESFEKEITKIKQLSKLKPKHTFNHFFEILNRGLEHKIDISLTEYQIERSLNILVNICDANPDDICAQVRIILGHNFFNLISSILSHCKLYRLYISNKLFRFLQHMFPAINTKKSKSFCKHFDIPVLLNRLFHFIVYRTHIDGDGQIDNEKFNYNDLYGVKMSLVDYMDAPVSIAIYFITSKYHKQFVFDDENLVTAIAILCIRLAHEIKREFQLEEFDPTDETAGKHYHKSMEDMVARFKIGEYKLHNVLIEVCMEFLYHYALNKDIKLVKIPLGNNGYELFKDSWQEYQFVIASLRLVTNNEYLGLYLDTIAKQLGYKVKVNEKFKKKKPSDLITHSVYETHKISCFAVKCNKTFDVNDKKLKKCSGCDAAYYCSKSCQKKHWKLHRKICNNNDMNMCDNAKCDKMDNLRRCTGCYDVWYCSIECQRKDWKQHKIYCKKKQSQK